MRTTNQVAVITDDCCRRKNVPLQPDDARGFPRPETTKSLRKSTTNAGCRVRKIKRALPVSSAKPSETMSQLLQQTVISVAPRTCLFGTQCNRNWVCAGTLMRAVRSAVFDFSSDIDQALFAFRRWVRDVLREEWRKQVWAVVGSDRGVLVAGGSADVPHKTADCCAPRLERCMSWNGRLTRINSSGFDTALLRSGNDLHGLFLQDAVQ